MNRVVTRCVNVRFRMQRQAVELESGCYITLSMNTDLKYSNGSVATRKFQCFVCTCGKAYGFIKHDLVVLINEDSEPCTVWHKNTPTFMSANIRRCEMWNCGQDKRVTTLRINEMYNITGICQFHKSVANCDKWPVYKGGQHRNFHCNSWTWTAFTRLSYFASRGKIYGTHYTGSWAGAWKCVNLVTKKNIRSVFSGMLCHVYHSTRRNVPQNMDLQQHRLQNLTRRKIVALPLPEFKFPWPTPKMVTIVTELPHPAMPSYTTHVLFCNNTCEIRLFWLHRACWYKPNVPARCTTHRFVVAEAYYHVHLFGCKIWMSTTDGTALSNITYITMSYH